MAPVVVLIGPPGAGKTTVGRMLADQWAVGFRDTDDDVQEIAGRPVADIFVDQGEAHFRELEAAAVADALRSHPGVLAVGGGAVCDPQTARALSSHRVLFLDVGVSDAASRVGLNRDRPLLLGNPRAQWQRLMRVRRPIYEALATITVVTDGMTVHQVLDAALHQLARSAPQ